MSYMDLCRKSTEEPSGEIQNYHFATTKYAIQMDNS